MRGRYVSNHSKVRLEAALAGLGVACAPAFMAQDALENGSLVQVLAGWEFQGNDHGHAWILYPPSRFTAPKCRVLIDHLLDALAAGRRRLNASSTRTAPPRAGN